MKKGTPYPARWYRPGDDYIGPGASGTYKVDANGRVEAHVFELFPDEKMSLFGPKDSIPSVLHGEVLGEGVTLVGCRVNQHRSGMTSQRDLTLSADYSLEGFGVLDPEELKFTHLKFRFTNQEEWTQWNRFSVMEDQSFRLNDLGVVLRNAPKYIANIDGSELELVDHSTVAYEHEAHRWILQSRTYFEYRFKSSISIDEALDRFVYPLQVMLLVACQMLPGLIDVAGHDRNWNFGSAPARRPSEWFQLRRYHGPVERPAISSLNYLFTLDDFEFASQMPKVIQAVNTHRYALSRYAYIRSDRFVGEYKERFSVAAQLIEAFDRTLRPDGKESGAFDKCLKHMEDESGNLVDRIIGNKKWRGELAVLRNIVLHGDSNADNDLRDQHPLVVGYEALMLLFEVRFFVELGFEPERAKRLVTRRANHRSIERAIQNGYPSLTLLVKAAQQRKSSVSRSRR